MSQESIKADLEKHPELSPILDTNAKGEVICLGWISPIFDYDTGPELLRKLEDENQTGPGPFGGKS